MHARRTQTDMQHMRLPVAFESIYLKTLLQFSLYRLLGVQTAILLNRPFDLNEQLQRSRFYCIPEFERSS